MLTCLACNSKKTEQINVGDNDVFTTQSGKEVSFLFIKHASFVINYDNLSIQIDPVSKMDPATDYSSFPKADFIFVTHEHFDHFDKEAIAALKKDVTNIYNGMREEYDSQVKAIEAPPEKKNPVRAFWNKVIYGGVLVGTGVDALSIQRARNIYADKQYWAETSTHEYYKAAQVNYDKFASLLSYMDEHYADDFTLDEAADFVGFSKYHFTRLFREYTGTTFLDYLTHKRVQAAQSLLASDLSVTEICFRTGFNNLTSFSRSFKNAVGVSPAPFREQSRGEGT